MQHADEWMYLIHAYEALAGLEKLWLKEGAVFVQRPKVTFDTRHITHADLYVSLLTE